ncbi:MFS transporter [Natronorubrum texcoconense]|uniref:Sugar phosphate permease n=1 Tax=Natronorubrum texcoconense TaxID=1095776 RepID=A0A1G8VKW5_9EURY|nr:MFS transporter [Natronorubrum texcoconense]SDJ66594.1 Sugar phosphate permease [Natronorubrum texcoconense]
MSGLTDVSSNVRARGWKGYTALILGWQVTASICFYSIYAVTPFVRNEYGVSATYIGVMMTALMTGYTLCLLPVGSIIDRYGEALVLSVGLLGLGVAAVVLTMAPSYPVLLVCVFVLGAFYATAMPGTNTAVFNAIPQERLNFSMGIKQVGVTAGSGISALVIPWFGATRFGWEAGFILAGAIALLVAVGFWIAYDEGGPSETDDDGGIRGHLANVEYAILTVAGFFLGAGLFTTTGYTILYVDEVVGAGVVFAGITLAAAQVAGSTGRIAFGWLADRLSGSLTTSTLAILIAQAGASVVLFVAVTVVDSPVVALVLFSLLGFVILGFTGIYYSCIGSLVSSDGIASATAGGQLALNSGALFAPPAFGYLVDSIGYGAAWSLLALSSLVALGLLIVLYRRNS